MSDQFPEGRHVSQRMVIALATLPVTAAVVWAFYHVLGAIATATGRGNPLATLWLFTFFLLWWIVASWFEKPYITTSRQTSQLRQKLITVAIPVFNGDADKLTDCIQSLFEQTRLPNKIVVVDDGSDVDYRTLAVWFTETGRRMGIECRWIRQENAGKRHAQMNALQNDGADIFVTIDDDSVLDCKCIEEGIKPFSDPDVKSVAGMVAVWNYKENFLTRLTGMLYTPFTRGFRSAQSVFGRVMVNSGTLAFYDGDTIRKYAESYPHETFLGKPMQMNDDSMMTFYGLLEGKAVHQPTSIAFTVVPGNFFQYIKQQKRWMRGTFVRNIWWLKYFKMNDLAFWMPLAEIASFILSLMTIFALVFFLPEIERGSSAQFWLYTLVTGVGLNYLISLRYFTIRRTDESLGQALLTFALAPVAGLWRLVILRPLYLYCYCTFWKVSSWGTRKKAEVELVTA